MNRLKTSFVVPLLVGMTCSSAQAISLVPTMITTMSSQAAAIQSMRQSSSSSSFSSHHHSSTNQQSNSSTESDYYNTEEYHILRILSEKREKAAEIYEQSHSESVARAMDLDDATNVAVECNIRKIRAYNESFMPTRDEAAQLNRIDAIADDAKAVGCFD